MSQSTPGRRTFLRQAGLAALALPLAQPLARARQPDPAASGRRKIAVFSKTLQWTELDQMAEMVAECGFDGLDLTVRPGGHIEPARVREELPRFAEAMRKVGKEIVMLTTAIGTAEEPHAEAILGTAFQLGIRYYRTGYYRYNAAKNIEANLKEFTARLKGLAAINAQYRIKAGYQNHAGTGFGAPVWDLGQALRQVDSPWVGCQYDIRHAMVEGANAWTLGFDYVKPFINTFIFKDYHWERVDGRWKPVNVSLGEGMVDLEAFYARIATLAPDIPGTLHMEFALGGAESGRMDVTITPAEMLAAMKANMAVVRRTLGS